VRTKITGRLAMGVIDEIALRWELNQEEAEIFREKAEEIMNGTLKGDDLHDLIFKAMSSAKLSGAFFELINVKASGLL
jgi:hypothetical protein